MVKFVYAKNNKAQLSTDSRPRKMSLKEQACSVIIDLEKTKSFFDNFYTKDVAQQVKFEIEQGMATANQSLTQFYYAGDLLRQATDLALVELKKFDEHFYTYGITDTLEFKSFTGNDQDFRKMLFEHINYLRMTSREWFSSKSRHASDHKVQIYKKKLDPKNLETLGVEDFSFCLSEELPYGQEIQIMDKLQHIFGSTKSIPREFAHLFE